MTNKQSKPEQSYQALKARLNDIVARLQADNLDLDEALGLYQQGQETIAELEKYLDKINHSFEKLRLEP
jgi:exodeoxyribonuclease VII small subunit